MLDLEEGIAGIFEEAQGGALDRIEEELERRGARFRAAWVAYITARRSRIDFELRCQRARAPMWSPPPVPVRLVPCPKCGATVELRQGCKRPANHSCAPATPAPSREPSAGGG